MKKWKITVGQLAPKTLDCRANAERAAGVMEECAAAGSELLVLPELYLSGYEIVAAGDGAKTLKEGVSRELDFLRQKTADTGVDLLISYPLFFAGDQKPFIALEYIAKGKTRALHRKINLCNYAQYTEHLTFAAGDAIATAKTEKGTAGLFVCEDLWHVTNAIFAAKAGAEALFYPSAATVLEKNAGEKCLANWQKITVGTAFTQTSYVVCCNQASSDTTLYFGGSHVVAPDGEIVAQLPLFEEGIAHVDLDMDYLRQIREMRPLLANERFEVYRNLL